MLFTYQSALIRQAFLLGRLSPIGWAGYFPFAVLVKTPVATLAALLASAGVGIWAWRKAGLRRAATWAAVCLLAPPAVFFLLAVRSNLNIGLRHVLEIYAPLYVAAGVTAAVALRQWRRPTAMAFVAIFVALAAETASAYPNFIAFFNVPARETRGGIALLGDSNLDWGQDLPALVNWQRANPQTRLYMAYFGLADPKAFGLRYVPLPGGYAFDRHPQWPTTPGVIAVSATYLQGVLVNPELYAEFYKPLAQRRPTARCSAGRFTYSPGRCDEAQGKVSKTGDHMDCTDRTRALPHQLTYSNENGNVLPNNF